MQIDAVEIRDGVAQVNLNGSLDVSGAARIERELATTVRSTRDLIVNLAGVSFLSSQGVRVLVANAKAMQSRGGRMLIIGATPNVGKVLKVIGAARIIPMAESLDDALKLLEAPGG